MGLMMTLLRQSPRARTSPGAVARPGGEGRRQHFVPKRQCGTEPSPLDGARRPPNTRSSGRTLPGGSRSRGTKKTLATWFPPPRPRATPRPAGPAPPYPPAHRMSRFPTSPITMPSKASGQAQGGKFPTRGQARLAPHLWCTHGCPPRRGAGRPPPSPALPSAPGCFFPAHDLPDLLNKPPGSGKPAAFLAGKAVKGSNGCWKRRGGENKPTTQSSHLQEPKGLLGFWFFFSPPVATQKQSQDRDRGVLGGSSLPLVPLGRASPAKPR